VRGEGFSLTAPRWCCDCGGPLDIEFTPSIPGSGFPRAPQSLWRYRAALPLDPAVTPVTLGEGMTPMEEWKSPAGRRVWVKMDHVQPTGSFKDRGAAVMISRLRALEIPAVVEDSSGNAGAAVAAYCARGGLACTVYVPASAPAAKIAQIRAYGARVKDIDGPREAAAAAVKKAARTTYYAGHCVDPFFIQGTKTVAYEVAEQLGWRSPRIVVAPLGNGTLVLGLIRGFSELVSVGLITEMPRIVAFQSRACNPLVRAFVSHDTDLFVPGTTLADGIAVARPVLGDRILTEIRRAKGEIRDVSEAAIQAAWKQWAVKGLSVEPTAAVALAGIDQLKVDNDAVVVATGHGLKRPH